MKIEVFSLDEILRFTPFFPTAVIRIKSSLQLNWGDLKDSSLYRAIFTYTFDESFVRYSSEVTITHHLDDSLAYRILSDISGFKDYYSVLAIHCNLGLNRSRALAHALSDVFGFEYDFENPLEEYSHVDWDIYYKLFLTAKREGFGVFKNKNK